LSEHRPAQRITGVALFQLCELSSDAGCRCTRAAVDPIRNPHSAISFYSASSVAEAPPPLPPLDGNQLAGSMGWVLRGIQEAYPDMTQPIAESLTPRGVEMLANTSRQCMVQTGVDYAFRHLQPWFKKDLYQTVRDDPLKSILAMQRIGNVKPTGPVYLSHN
jgi:hypothetical protein